MKYQFSSLFPKVLSTLLLSYTCYVTVLIRGTPGIAEPVVFLGLYFLSLFTYYKIIIVGPGFAIKYKDVLSSSSTTSMFSLQETENTRQNLKPHVLVQHSINLNPKFCHKCQIWKPDRCHHCSSCRQCVLKMDHHCPWFALCIGYDNQKYFIQFLVYSTVYSIAVFALNFATIYRWFQKQSYEKEIINLNILFTCFISLITSISMIMFSSLSIWLVLKNLTTIEHMDRNERRIENDILIESRLERGARNVTRNDVNMFDLGSKRKNWNSVMGTSVAEWLMPTSNRITINNKHSLDEHGLWFDVNDSYKKDIELQQRLLERLSS